MTLKFEDDTVVAVGYLTGFVAIGFFSSRLKVYSIKETRFIFDEVLNKPPMIPGSIHSLEIYHLRLRPDFVQLDVTVSADKLGVLGAR